METLPASPLATPLESLATACAPVAENAAFLIDHLVGGRWREAALLARGAVVACGEGALAAAQGLLPAFGL